MVKKKKKVDSLSSMKLSPIKKDFQWTDFIKDLSTSKDSNVNFHRENEKKKKNEIMEFA